MNIVEKFLHLTESSDAPYIYRKWAILVTCAAIFNRSVWTSIRGGMPLFPNLYTLLVGPPGTGKGMALRPAKNLLSTQSHIRLAPDSTSYEKLINILGEQSKEDLGGTASASLFLEEWGTFMREPSNDFCAMMATLYDCQDYAHEVLSRATDNASNLYVNICSCCTPEWFAEGFPPNSYGQGLPTRFQFVYAEQSKTADIADFDFQPASARAISDPITNALFADACTLASLRGFVAWTSEAGELFNEWKNNNFNPVPTDPMLVGYNQRRHLHVAKLATIVALANHPTSMFIEAADLQWAMDTLFEVEVDMPKALRLAGGNQYSARMLQVRDFVRKKFMLTKKPVAEWQVRQQLAQLVPPNMVGLILDELIKANSLKTVGPEKHPYRRIIPGVNET